LDWFSDNKFEEYTLDQNTIEFVPVGITVGDEMAPGIKTKPGEYFFTLKIYNRDKNKWEGYQDVDFSYKVR